LEARNAFQPLAEAADAHAFREASQFQLALLLEEAAKNSDALPKFAKLAQGAQNPEIRAESATRAALLHLKLEQRDKAIPALETALKTPGTDKWHALLRTHLFDSSMALGLHQKAIDFFPELEPHLQPDQRSEKLAQLAEAHLGLKQHKEALQTLEKIISLDPSAPAALKARYDRLRCFYNLDAPEFLQEIDDFLALNPPELERDNALVMQAETLRAKGNFASAGAAFARAAQSKVLPLELKVKFLPRWIECAKNSENSTEILQATTQLLTAAPDHSFAPTALAARAWAHLHSRSIPEAEKDLRQLVDRYPKAKERQNALLQLALRRGEQDDNAGMAKLFETFLQDYPDSPDAPQAHHWIGWAAYKAKDYAKAIPHLEAARKALPDQYGEENSLRLIDCAYQLNDAEACWKRIAEYPPQGKTRIPADILRWIARQFAEAKDPAKSEPAWDLLCQSEEARESDWLALAQDRLQLNRYEPALKAIQAYQKFASTPASQSLGWILHCRAQIGLTQPEAAQQALEQALRLQPEGRLNAEARILAGDVQAAKGQWEAAAKTYASVAVVIDDEELAPLALLKAQKAYQQAGKTKESADTLNRLQSRYPEYARKNLR
jgi:tetratricopeptide (TPR) repeat protein